MIALFIDTFSRDLEVFTVSVTKVADRGLVLRYGAKVGNLWQLTEGGAYGVFRNEDMPVIVATRGYAAQSSGGFVEVLADFRGEGTRLRTHVIGLQGMPFQKRKGLSVMSNPMEVLVLRPGTNIVMLDTHARRKPGEGWHSNPATANAAIQGIKLRSAIRPNSVFVLEGQSDYAQAWELTAEHEAYAEPFTPDFPEEFRAERFTAGALAQAFVRRMDAARQVFCLALGKVAETIQPLDYWGWVRSQIQSIVGINHDGLWKTFVAGAADALERKLEEGYSLRLTPEVGRSRVEIVSPSGETSTEYLDLGCDGDPTRYVIENLLLDFAGNSDDEKVAIRRDRRAEMLRQYFMRPPRENAEEYELRSHELLHSGKSYRLVPASHTDYRSSDDWRYEPVRDLPVIESSSIGGIFSDPRFIQVANGANILFLVSYDENGKAQAASHVEWGSDFNFGWQGIQSHSAMLKALSVEAEAKATA